MFAMGRDSLGARRTLRVGGAGYEYFDLSVAAGLPGAAVARLPKTLKILLENLLRHEDGDVVTVDQIATLAAWPSSRRAEGEIAYHPARVLTHDASGIPLLADLSAMRDAVRRKGIDPSAVNPQIPVDLVADHSVSAEFAGTRDAFDLNLESDYRRNHERYAFLRWAEQAWSNFRIVPPGAGIVHQVNLEYLARPVRTARHEGETWAFPDSLVGMDSHTPMINGLGVIGWGVGGIEAGAAMLGEPLSLQIPEVIGCRFVNALRPGTTAMDLTLAVTEALRARNVIGKFVEYFGPGVPSLSLADRATIANMAPEYGATMGYFPIDGETLRYLAETGREPADIALAEAYAIEQGLFGGTEDAAYTDIVQIDLAEIFPSMAGPRRPQDRRPLAAVPASFRDGFPQAVADRPDPAETERPLRHGDVVIAAITSCTNTSNPDGMLGAALLARNAVARGLVAKPWVKTSLSPGSRAVTDYLTEAGLMKALESLGFHIAGYGCMTCSGGSGPLAAEVADAVDRNELAVVAALSANRNFEGRVHPQVRGAYIGSPALIVAYALAGSILVDLTRDPLGTDADGRPVHLQDLWPQADELRDVVGKVVNGDAFRRSYAGILEGDRWWQRLPVGQGDTYDWDPASTYLRRPPYFDEGVAATPRGDIPGARPLLLLGDSVTTDHINPMGAIPKQGPAADFLASQDVPAAEYHSYLERRANHEVMLRGIFANIRLRNRIVPGVEGGFTRHFPDGDVLPVYDAAMRYAQEEVPLVVVAGAEYGTGSSRDWAAKGTRLLGVRAVIAESFERIHRSNLVCMGVLPLQLPAGTRHDALGLDGSETFDLEGTGDALSPGSTVRCTIRRADGSRRSLNLTCRMDTAREVAWYRAGGILNYAMQKILDRQLLDA